MVEEMRDDCCVRLLKQMLWSENYKAVKSSPRDSIRVEVCTSMTGDAYLWNIPGIAATDPEVKQNFSSIVIT